MSDVPVRSAHRRIFTATPIPEGTTDVPLTREDAHYLTRVLRLNAGADVDIADGTGRLFAGTLTAVEDGWIVRNCRVLQTITLPAPRIVCAALIKADRWEWMLEKAAEIGATHIIPIEAARSVVRIATHKQDKKLQRWTRILSGAARQCERLSAVTIEAPCRLSDVATRLTDHTLLVLDEVTPRQKWPPHNPTHPVACFTGPEGGWTDDERQTLYDAGAHGVGLGDNLLRAETATLAALTILRAQDHGLV